MCGIIGIVHKDRRKFVDEDKLIKMRDLLTHRGPDDAGLHTDGHAGIGHRRLSIIDLSSGQQPMTNEDGTLWIVFNGEIYNFKSLREYLLAKGHVFKTRSDTETILHLYEEEGTDCVSKLNGIFAFAIWDQKQKTLFLARDHMGVKPLYYAETDEAFVFASEIKAILNSSYVQARCADESVTEYFLFRHVSDEKTLFQGIKTLLPASTLLLKNETTKTNRYWSPYPAYVNDNQPREKIAFELSAIIEDAVKIQLMSDVPLGTFCSGGLDSSLVTAFAAKLTGMQINTFSVGFEEKEYDETASARIVSQKYGTTHHEIKVGNYEFADLLPKMVWYNDEPLNYANSVQIYAISKLAKESVTVVLTGEGSDELYMGYPRYHIPRISAYYRALPSFVKVIASSYADVTGNHRIEKIHKYSMYSAQDALLYNASFLHKDYLREILKLEVLDGYPYRIECLRKGKEAGLDDMTSMAILDQQNYMVSILNRQDKMSMAASIESRVPFLDYRVVEYANRIPVKYKTGLFRTKDILKRIANDYLPKKIVNQRKSGFGVPLKEWFKDSTGMGKYLVELCDDDDMNTYMDKNKVRELITEHRNNVRDHSEFLWAAVNFMLWKKCYIK